MLRFSTVASFDAAAASSLFRCNEIVSRRSERSLLYDFKMCYIIIEMLCWNDYVCLMKIDRYDKWLNDVQDGTLAQAYT